MPLRACLGLVVAVLVAACSSAPAPENAASSAGAVAGFPGCSGVFNTSPSPTGAYYATDFGCSSNPYFNDPGDTCGSASCVQSAYDQGVCSSGQSHADCQRAVNWYSVGGASYGCGARLQVTNPASGKSVVVLVLDNGPSCTVENDANFWVLDVSYPTIQYLFGQEEGWGDHARVNAVVVDSSTPLGPVGTAAPPPPDTDGGTAVAEAGPAASCNTDGDCNPGTDGSGQICVGGTCMAGCNADWECPGGQTCVSGQCQ
jgi:hypothetical protein